MRCPPGHAVTYNGLGHVEFTADEPSKKRTLTEYGCGRCLCCGARGPPTSTHESARQSAGQGPAVDGSVGPAPIDADPGSKNTTRWRRVARSQRRAQLVGWPKRGVASTIPALSNLSRKRLLPIVVPLLRNRRVAAVHLNVRAISDARPEHVETQVLAFLLDRT